MTIFRVLHQNNYTVVNNFICTDKRLTYKAKGIWLYAFSRPDNWEFYLSDLINQSADGKSSVQSGLKELERFGYLERTLEKNMKGQFASEYLFYETPKIKEKIPEPKIRCGLSAADNQPLLSTEEESTKEEVRTVQENEMGVISKRDEGHRKMRYKEEPSKEEPYKEEVRTVQEEDANTATGCADDIVSHPLFIPSTTKAKARTWFAKNPKEAEENLNHLNSELQKLHLPHIKLAIAEFLAQWAPDQSINFGECQGTLQFKVGPQSFKTGLNGKGWEAFVLEILKHIGKDEFYDKVVKSLENKTKQNVKSDIEEWRKNADRKRTR